MAEQQTYGMGSRLRLDESGASNIVFFQEDQMPFLLRKFLDPDFGEGWLYSALADVAQSILHFPIRLNYYDDNYYKSGIAYYLGTILTTSSSLSSNAVGIQPKYPLSFYMIYDLGETYYRGYYNNYLDYEPYSKVKIYLPFYGYHEVSVKDIYKKYIQFRIVIDFKTGDATYYIGVSNKSLINNRRPYYYTVDVTYDENGNETSHRWYANVDDRETIFISSINVNIAQKITPTRSNASELERNLILSSIGSALAVASTGVSLSAGLGVSTSMMTVSPSTSTTKYSGGSSTYNDSIQTINPKTNRLRTTLKKYGGSQYNPHTSTTYNSGYTTTRAYNRENYLKQKMVGDVTSSISNIISSFNVNTTTEKPASSILSQFGSMDIFILTEVTHKPYLDNDSYNRLYGRPLGEIRKLSTLQGYTEITNIHLEGEGFSTATEEEIAKIYSDLAQGFIV